MQTSWTATAEKTWDIIKKHLPYLLQDIDAFGFDQTYLHALMDKYIGKHQACNVLELNAGKGAYSISLAKTFGWQTKGVELLADFVTIAKQKADDQGVGHLCEFEQGNPLDVLLSQASYDVIVYDTLMGQLAEAEDVLLAIADAVHDEGYVVLRLMLDVRENPRYDKESSWNEAIELSGFNIVDRKYEDLRMFKTIENERIQLIEERLKELLFIYPQHENELRDYLDQRKKQLDDLDKGLMGVTMILDKVES